MYAYKRACTCAHFVVCETSTTTSSRESHTSYVPILLYTRPLSGVNVYLLMSAALARSYDDAMRRNTIELSSVRYVKRVIESDRLSATIAVRRFPSRSSAMCFPAFASTVHGRTNAARVWRLISRTAQRRRRFSHFNGNHYNSGLIFVRIHSSFLQVV